MATTLFPENYTLEAVDKLIDGKREEARRREQNMAECQYDLSDCFVSVWANDIYTDLYRLLRGVVEYGGKSVFSWLCDATTGEPLRCRIIDTRYGSCYALCDENGKFTGTFVSLGLSEKALAKRGYTVKDIELPALVTIEGKGHGLSGSAWATIVPDWRDEEVKRLTGRK